MSAFADSWLHFNSHITAELGIMAAYAGSSDNPKVGGEATGSWEVQVKEEAVIWIDVAVNKWLMFEDSEH